MFATTNMSDMPSAYLKKTVMNGLKTKFVGKVAGVTSTNRLTEMAASGALKAIFESHGVAYAPALAAG